MSNYKVMLHRFLNSSSQRSKEQLLTKLKDGVKLKGGVWKNSCVQLFNDKLTFFKTLGQQCNIIVAHRARRTEQIFRLYRDLYGRKSPSQVFKSIGDLLRNPQLRSKKLFLLGAVLFDWKDCRISDRELDKVGEELKVFFDLKTTNYHDTHGEVWEKVHDEDHFKLWRCPVPGSHLYKYKVFGSYRDIPARAFLNIQLDLEYRKTWDSHIMRLEKVDEDKQTGTQVVYWATQFPLGFLYHRDYVYVRRFKIDKVNNIMTLTARSVDHHAFPVTKDFIRVGDYTSNMVIRPHKSFDEDGLDYVMYYYDDPQLYVPTWAINKMTVSSLPSFLERLHKAAKQYTHTSQYITMFESEESMNTNNRSNRTDYTTS